MEKIISAFWFEPGPDETADKAAATSFAVKLTQAQGLKTFPVVAQKILSMFADSDFRVDAVTRVIEEDPSMAASVLRVANSAFFAPSRPITEMKQAFMRVGVSHVKEIVCAVATMEMFRDADGLGIRIRDHCAAVAGLAHFLGKQTCGKAPEGIFLAGLLHDIGKMMLIESYEIDYPAGSPMIYSPDLMHEFERRRLGYDHGVLGAHIVSSWHFGSAVSKMIAWHHQQQRAFSDAEFKVPVSLLRLADYLDYLLSLSSADFIRDVQMLVRSEEAEAVGLTETMLLSDWDTLHEVRNDALSTFTVRH
ncbi:MAG: HDOD domain-containing protein [Deltaproteobacteria bacterium]|nr:HDOD domain-containing protein [Deltaproteobacteria bacterium]